MSPGTTELTSFTNNVQLIGRSQSDNYPSTVGQVGVVCAVKPNYELIIADKPHVIIYDQDLFSTAEIQKLKDGLPQTAFMEVKGNTVDDFLKDVYRLGTVTLCETGVADYADRVKAEETVCRSEPFTPRPKAAMVMAFPNSNPMVAGVKSFYADLARVAGAEPVGPDSAKFETMTVEALIALNPDVIIVPAKKGDYSELTKDPRMAQLTAVKKGKIIGIPPDYVLRRGARVDIALKNLHSGLLSLFK